MKISNSAGKKIRCDVSSAKAKEMMQIFDEASSDVSWKAWESPPKKARDATVAKNEVSSYFSNDKCVKQCQTSTTVETKKV